jgi:hypothetical protein
MIGIAIMHFGSKAGDKLLVHTQSFGSGNTAVLEFLGKVFFKVNEEIKVTVCVERATE